MKRKKAEKKDELSRDRKLRNLLIEIATVYINLPLTDFDREVNRSLASIGQLSSADRLYIFEYQQDYHLCSNTFEWCASGISAQIDELQNIPMAGMEDWLEAHLRGELMIVEAVDRLPADSRLRQTLEPQGILSIIAAPLMDQERCIGFIGLDYVRQHNHFTSTQIKLVRLFAQLVVSVQQRRQQMEDRQRADEEYRARLLAEARLDDEKERLQTALEAAQAGSWEWFVQERRVEFSKRWLQALGYAQGLTLEAWQRLIHPDDLPAVMKFIAKHISGETDRYEVEYRIRHAEGHWLWIRSYGRIMHWNTQGKPTCVVGIDIDITPQKHYQEHIAFVEHHDVLTNLPNRTLFTQLLNIEIDRCQRDDSLLALAYIDLDSFSLLNQQNGHGSGDQILQAIALRLTGMVRDHHHVARIGGDEFAIILTGLKDKKVIAKPVKRILRDINQPFVFNNLELKISASIGVTLYPQVLNPDAEQLLRQADQAMYQAKIAGKNRYHLFNPEEDISVRSRFELIEEMKRALQQQELAMFYQPKVNMRSGQIIGYEALIRWLHPQRGLIAPALFMPTLESHPISIEIGHWVIDAVLRQLEQWRQQGLITNVSINVNNLQLHAADFVQQLASKLERYPDLSAGQLEVEILESGALEDINHVSAVITRLQGMGIHCALDDYGTGYSSLTFLKKLPAQVVKIDQSFISGLLEDPEQIIITDSIIGLSRSLGRRALAEGVETIEQGTLLLELGCDYGQGYVIARPMPATDVATWQQQWQQPDGWKNIPRLDPQQTQILLAEVQHSIWLKSLKHYLRTGHGMPPALSAKSCRFSHWLNQPDTVQRYGSRIDFRHIDSLHEHLHQTANAVIQTLQEHAGADPEPGIRQLLAISHELLAALRTLRATAQEP